MTELLARHIRSFCEPSTKELDQFLKLFTTETLKPKEHLLQQGQVCHSLYFIVSGCFRCYIIHKNGSEKTINFALENWWLADFDSLLNSKPSDLHIQAIEKATLLKIKKSDLDQFLESSLAINQYFRIIQEKVRVADQRRIQYFFNLSGKELYTMFCEYNPEFVNRIPQYMLASYLGFTPEFLSKIRAEK